VAKTLAELGAIIVEAVGKSQVEEGYQHSADDLAEVGRSALLWGDINKEGELT
jgi:hypothetical protein